MIKFFCKIEQKGNICMNVFCDENDLIILSMYQMKNLKIVDHLLLIKDENNSYYVYIKDFNRFVCNNTNKNKKRFSRYFLHCLDGEKVLKEH